MELAANSCCTSFIIPSSASAHSCLAAPPTPAPPTLGSPHQLCSGTQLPCSPLPSPCYLRTKVLFVEAANVADACSGLLKRSFNSRTLQENLLIPIRCNLSHISDPKSKVLKESPSHFLFVNVNEHHSISGFALLEHIIFFLPGSSCLNYLGSRSFRDLVALTFEVSRVLSPKLNREVMLLLFY